MKKALLSLLVLAQAAWVQEVPNNRYGLSKVSWSGTNHQEGGTTRIGGYLRNPNTEFDWETLIVPDLSNVNGTIDSVVVRVHTTGGQTGFNSSIQLFEQPVSGWNPSTVNYDTFGNTQWSNLLSTLPTPNNVNPQWFEFRGPNLNQLAINWQNGTTSNNGVVLAANFWYFGYYVEIDDAEVLVYSSGNTNNNDIAQLLSFENFAADWPNQGQLDVAQSSNNPTQGAKSLLLNHFDSSAPISGLRSRFFDPQFIPNDVDYLLVDVKVSDDASLSIVVGNPSLNKVSIGTIAINNSNGSYQTIAFPLTQSIRDFINSGDIRFELNPSDGNTFEIELDNLRFSSSLP